MLLPTLRRSILTSSAARSTTRAAPFSRPMSQTPALLARKDTQHKDSLKPEPNEYSKSGSDDAAAAVENAAFDPKQTRPETEKASAEAESGSEQQTSPLDVSPANHDVSATKTKNEGATGSPSGGQVSKSRETAASGGSSAPKSGGGKSGGGSAN
ncbi:hypothetical protein Q7P37_000960 [Cladosporium fusiforme]